MLAYLKKKNVFNTDFLVCKAFAVSCSKLFSINHLKTQHCKI